MHFALVNVITGSIVFVQYEASLAATLVGAPIVDAALMAQSWIFLALVHIDTNAIVRWIVLEAGFAFASERSTVVDAFRIRGARLAFFELLALVDVLTVAILADDVASGADAGVSTLFVLANLLRAAIGLSRLTLVDVDALLAIVAQCVATGASHCVLTAITAVCVDALLISRTRIRSFTLVNVFKSEENGTKK